MDEKGKKLGLWNLIGFGLGNAIGTGIFVMMGYGIVHTGRSITLALVLGCLVMLLANWAIISMSAMFVFKGGDYGMKTLLFNPLLTGVNAWFTVINSFGFSSLALAFTGYLCVLFPGLTAYTPLVAFVVITIAFAVTVRGSRFLTLVENAITVVLVVALITFVAFGVGNVDAGTFFSPTYDGGFFRGGAGGLMAAVALMSFTCMGQTAPVAMATVSDRPKRNIPLSILIITLIIIIIYAAMAYVASGVLPYEQSAGQNISVTAKAIFPSGLFMLFVVGGGLCAIGSSMLSTLGYIRYPLKQIADEGWLPAVFKKHTKSGYPHVTYALYYAISVIPLLLHMDLDAVISLIMIPMMLIQFYMNLACIRLPKKYPEQWEKRSIKTPLPLYYICAVLGAGCAGMVVWNLFINLSVMEMIFSILIIVILLGLSAIRLKQGAVKVEDLAAQRELVAAEAIAADMG